MKTVVSIAGSDSSGGAGIQADLKTLIMNGVYGMSVVTALTAQNTLGVTGIYEVSAEFVGQQMEAVFEDIPPDAVKVGMVSSACIIHEIAEKLKKYKGENIVVDPVMVATSGARLIRPEALEALRKELLPLASVMTPNLPEAEILLQAGEEESERAFFRIRTKKDMERAARRLGEKYKVAVLLKGGHAVEDANDLLFQKGEFRWYKGRRIPTPNTHGTGCTLSSAIAANLAKKFPLEQAVEAAKEYISKALEDGLDLGEGSGPMNHGFCIPEAYRREK
ncbi:bifunctional hydroxymethylpyrimidine kinase/phosphomethylpyrimidine kinase [Clostridiaceae bacterium 68-1-5]|uniref:Hydroxymethylpyrimidine/phosphomethylpyrimidine kinase n=1 Tax=Suipraeoptans intestinalis TaxID=2606628 RepID=A0A6N7UT94_9FIRM|nr:bifunctional hydroxymethylpyrimidine kinase/phosphomethylpyrimidine kinase [Suipraeoptans intestinalis]MSR94204.1 bifunctional hydroxymethylpyrimidine kinase/phosphomethylpyrimidine kinase [Suipraeoptans intestinalis]